MGCTGSKLSCKTPEATTTEDGQPRQEVAAPPNSLQGNLARTRQVQSVSECYELVEVLGSSSSTLSSPHQTLEAKRGPSPHQVLL